MVDSKILWYEFINFAHPHIIYMFYLFQGEPPGTTRLLRVKVLNGVNLAKKDIFGAR